MIVSGETGLPLMDKCTQSVDSDKGPAGDNGFTIPVDPSGQLEEDGTMEPIESEQFSSDDALYSQGSQCDPGFQEKDLHSNTDYDVGMRQIKTELGDTEHRDQLTTSQDELDVKMESSSELAMPVDCDSSILTDATATSTPSTLSRVPLSGNTAVQRYAIPISPKPYQCSVCQKAFRSVQILQKHALTFHSRPRSSLPLSKVRGKGRGKGHGAQYFNRQLPQEDLEPRVEPREYHCVICNCSFHTTDSLQNHVAQVHIGSDISNPTVTSHQEHQTTDDTLGPSLIQADPSLIQMDTSLMQTGPQVAHSMAITTAGTPLTHHQFLPSHGTSPGSSIALNVSEASTSSSIGRRGASSMNSRVLIDQMTLPRGMFCEVVDPKIALCCHNKGCNVSDFLEAGGIPSVSQRRLLVRLVVDALIQQCGSLYPTAAQKTALAKAIVAQYPVTMDTTPGLKGYEHFYDNGAGFIEYRLKNLRMASRTEEDKDKVRAKRIQNKCQRTESNAPVAVVPQLLQDYCEEDMSEQVNMMKCTTPNAENWAAIKILFQETFAVRRKEVENLTTADFLLLYPRIIDMPDLINLEFELMHSTCSGNFVAKWATYFTPRIIRFVGQEDGLKELIQLYQGGDDDLCALVMLIYITYRSACNSKKNKDQEKAAGSRSESVKYFIQHIADGAEIHSAINDGERKKYRHPYLLAVGPLTKPNQYYVVLDNKTPVDAGTTIVAAVDRLFKAHYVFNLKYVSSLLDFWEFIDRMVYCVKNPADARPHVRSIASSIRAVQL